MVETDNVLVPAGVRALRRPGETLIQASAAPQPKTTTQTETTQTTRTTQTSTPPPPTKHTTQPTKAPTTKPKSRTTHELDLTGTRLDPYRPTVFKTSTKAHPNDALLKAAHRQAGTVAHPVATAESTKPTTADAKRPQTKPSKSATQPEIKKPSRTSTAPGAAHRLDQTAADKERRHLGSVISVTTSVGHSKERTFVDKETAFGRVKVVGRVGVDVTHRGQKAPVEVFISPDGADVRVHDKQLTFEDTGLVAAAKTLNVKRVTELLQRSVLHGGPVTERIRLPGQPKEKLGAAGLSRIVPLKYAEVTVSLMRGSQPNEIKVEQELSTTNRVKLRQGQRAVVTQRVALTTTIDYHPPRQKAPVRVGADNVAIEAAALATLAVALGLAVTVVTSMGSGGEGEDAP